MFPADRMPVQVAVEYDSRGVRTIKTFPNAWQARSFYIAKCKAGRNPKVVKV